MVRGDFAYKDGYSEHVGAGDRSTAIRTKGQISYISYRNIALRHIFLSLNDANKVKRGILAVCR